MGNIARPNKCPVLDTPKSLLLQEAFLSGPQPA